MFIACSGEKSTTTEPTIPKEITKSATERTATYSETNNAYFGDLHVHTSWSFDAFIYNVRTTPEDAYDFGMGKKIDHISGKKIQLGRLLDFMAVTDHAEYMGVMKQMLEPNNQRLFKNGLGVRLFGTHRSKRRDRKLSRFFSGLSDHFIVRCQKPRYAKSLRFGISIL